MSDEKFSQLPSVTNAKFTDIIAAVQSSLSVQETHQQVFNLYLANMVLNYSGNPNGNVAGVIYQFCWDTLDNFLYVCTTNGDATTAVWTFVNGASLPINTIHIQTFLPGTSTYIPSAGMKYCIAEMIGGGGSGGGVSCIIGQAAAATGGGAGGYSRKLYTAANIGSTASIIVGDGGIAAIAGANNGNAGGNSTLVPTGTGPVLTCNGGGGGIGMASTASTAANSISGIGGSSSGGDLNISGQYGTCAFVLASVALAVSGSGGSNVLGQGGGTISFSGAGDGNPGIAGQGYGSGSGGAIITGLLFNEPSQSGQPGICIITEFI